MKRKSFKILVILVVNIAILALLELSLRVTGFARPWERPDPFSGFYGNYRVYSAEMPCPGLVMYRTNPNKLNTFQLETFAVRKPVGTVRVFCLGGSTVNGGVYRETFARVLKLLAFREPWGKRMEVINAGGNGYDSAQIVHLARELVQYQPDVLVVVTGHNEFSSLRYQSGLLSQGPALRCARVFLDAFRLTHLVRSLAGRGGDARVVFDFKPPGGPVTAAERDTIVNRMDDNLHRLADLSKQHGIILVLGIAASNLRYVPVGDTGAAPGAFRRAADLRDRGMTAEARSAYREALTSDDVPKRIVPAQQQRIRETAERLGVLVVDFQRLFEQHAADGIPGDDLFLDFCHPNFEGNIIMARAVRDVLKSLPFPVDGEKTDGETLEECAVMTPESSCQPGDCPFTINAQSESPASTRVELETAVERGFGLEALAAAEKLAGQPGYTGSDILQRWFDSTDFVILQQLFLKRAGCLDMVVVPVLLDALEKRHFAFDARQSLLRLTGAHFGLRSYQPSSGGAEWHRWWKNTTLKRRRLLVRKNLQQVVVRLDSDDLNVRLAAIAILEEFAGTTLGYDPLALRAEREAAVGQWQKMWRDLTAVNQQ